MKYIGNKNRLLGFIENSLVEANVPLKGTFVDLFAGTANVGFHFKQRGMKIVSNDIMTYSYYLQRAMLEINEVPKFAELKKYLKLKMGIPLVRLISVYLIMVS